MPHPVAPCGRMRLRLLKRRKEFVQKRKELWTVHDIAEMIFFWENLQDGSGNGGGNALCFPFFYDVFGAGKNQRGNMDRAKLCFFDVRLFEHHGKQRVFFSEVAKPYWKSDCKFEAAGRQICAAYGKRAKQRRTFCGCEQSNDAAVAESVKGGLNQIKRLDKGNDIVCHIVIVHVRRSGALAMSAAVKRIYRMLFGKLANQNVKDFMRFAVSVHQKDGRAFSAFFVVDDLSV